MAASIHSQPNKINKRYTSRALSWIGYATRTLAVEELQAAISVNIGQFQLNSDKYELEDLLTSAMSPSPLVPSRRPFVCL